jgi:hypothetical protein
MSVTNAGRDHICSAIIGGAVTAFTSANAYIGVGSGTTAFANTQTTLVSQLSNGRKAMNSTYPTLQASNTMRFQSTFGTSDANGAWEEWGVFNASSGGTMLNRKAETLGTKSSAQTWQFTVDITITVP